MRCRITFNMWINVIASIHFSLSLLILHNYPSSLISTLIPDLLSLILIHCDIPPAIIIAPSVSLHRVYLSQLSLSLLPLSFFIPSLLSLCYSSPLSSLYCRLAHHSRIIVLPVSYVVGELWRNLPICVPHTRWAGPHDHRVDLSSRDGGWRLKQAEQGSRVYICIIFLSAMCEIVVNSVQILCTC